jgi:hypothetical protein
MINHLSTKASLKLMRTPQNKYPLTCPIQYIISPKKKQYLLSTKAN